MNSATSPNFKTNKWLSAAIATFLPKLGNNLHVTTPFLCITLLPEQYFSIDIPSLQRVFVFTSHCLLTIYKINGNDMQFGRIFCCILKCTGLT